MDAMIELSARDVLKRRFGFSRFRAGQAEIIHAALSGRDVLAVMPTGGGKSMGYVLPALLLDRPVLVVSPLIALMKDQVDALRAREIPAAYVNSTMLPSEQLRVVEAFRDARIRLLFVAPERFRSQRFLDALDGFRPGLFAVDEAHCISEWGHDFRPDYLRLKDAAARVGRPPIVALTATATPEVRRHVVENLGLDHPVVIVEGFERPNLDFVVTDVASKEGKLEHVQAEIERGGTGLVYAATRKNVEELTMKLRRAGHRVGFYHAGLTDSDRAAVHERFADGTLSVVVATNAFGMGIDRADLRFVVHHDLPGSVEAYTQEAGRAGRDGEPARCVLLYQKSDARLQRFFIETAYPPPPVVLGALNLLRRAGPETTFAEDDVVRLTDANVHARLVDSALRILAEHGVAARGLDRDGRRVVRFVADAELDFGLMRLRAEREYARLQLVLDYAERAGCRRAFLVDYFAGDGAFPACGRCGGCLRESRRREVTGDELTAVRTLLELVRTLDGRYGRKKLVLTLAGSKAKDVVTAGLDRHPSYGALADRRTTFLDALLNECAAKELLRAEAGEYPVISITAAGRRVLAGEEIVELACFDAQPPAPPARPAADRPELAASADPTLVQRLREWRRVEAQAAGMPPYVIFHDRTLFELAATKPRTEADLLEVNGIGPTKVERFGARLLEILREP